MHLNITLEALRVCVALYRICIQGVPVGESLNVKRNPNKLIMINRTFYTKRLSKKMTEICYKFVMKRKLK